MILHRTYPDNFMQEQETTITQLMAMADDPEVKAIIVAQAVPGTLPAIQKIRRKRDDLIFLLVLNTLHSKPDLRAFVALMLLSSALVGIDTVSYFQRTAQPATPAVKL